MPTLGLKWNYILFLGSPRRALDVCKVTQTWVGLLTLRWDSRDKIFSEKLENFKSLVDSFPPKVLGKLETETIKPKPNDFLGLPSKALYDWFRKT